MVLFLDSATTKLFEIHFGKDYSTSSADPVKMVEYARYNSLFDKTEILKVVLINTGAPYIIEDQLEKYLSSPYFQSIDNPRFSDEIKNEAELLKKTIIFNKEDLGPLYDLKVKKLQEVIGKDTVCFESSWLSEYLIKILKKLDNVKGYRFSRYDHMGEQVSDEIKIEDNQRHFKIFMNIKNNEESPLAAYTNIPSLFSEAFVKSKGPVSQQSPFYSAFQDFVNNKQPRIILQGGDRFLAAKFISEIQEILGHFSWYDCTDGTYELNNKMERFVFTNVEKLAKSALSNLCTELAVKKNKGKPVILHTNSSLDYIISSEFCKVLIPAFDECKKILYIYFALMVKEKGIFPADKIQEVQRMKDVFMFGWEGLNEILTGIKSLEQLDTILDLIKHIPNKGIPFLWSNVFWFDLADYIHKNMALELTDHNLKNINTIKNPKESILDDFVFALRDDKWVIIFRGDNIIINDHTLVALYYIRSLLSNPQRDLHPSHIKMVARKMESYREQKSYNNIGLSVADAKKFNNADGTAIPVASRKTIATLKSQIDKYENDLQKFKHTEKNTPVYYKTKELINELTKNLKAASLPSGRLRYIKKQGTLDYDSVTKAIDRIIKNLKMSNTTANQSFAVHLDNAIVPTKEKSYQLVYYPDIIAHWITD